MMEFNIVDKKKKSFEFKQKIHTRSRRALIIIMFIYALISAFVLYKIYNIVNFELPGESVAFWAFLIAILMLFAFLFFMFFFGDAIYDNDLALRLKEKLIIQGNVLEYVYSLYNINGEETKVVCIANLSKTKIKYIKKDNVFVFSGDTRCESYKNYDISKVLPVNQMKILDFKIPFYYEDNLLEQLKSLGESYEEE